MIKKSLIFKNEKKELPLVPLRELVVFPYMVTPFFAGRTATIKAIERALETDRQVFLVCQKTNSETPAEEDLHHVGTSAKILQMLKLPDGTLRVLVEGLERGTLNKIISRKDSTRVIFTPISEDRNVDSNIAALMAAARKSFKKYAGFQKKVSQDVLDAIEKAEYPDKLIDLIAANINVEVEKKIEILAVKKVSDRLETLTVIIESENNVLELQNRIQLKVQKKLEQNQKEYFLNEQIRQINKELGNDNNDPSGAKELERRIKEANPPKEVLAKAESEIKRLSRLQPMSPESGVLRTYLEWIADLPWSKKSTDNKDIDLAAKILDEDHYNMKKAKERILDFIAVRQLKESMKGPILCLVGPPGTGKTSLGRSIARALDRKFVRVSLGGVKDEAEIRGHRKTYVGALPGKVIQSMKKAGTVNPVFLLDEIDKMSSDFRGDPSSALLEVLDPQQNNTFVDHYLEIPYDLSKIMFLTTANSLHTIPYPLLDRMEIIEIPGYTDFEKERIASQFIIPRQLEENGLEWADISFQKSAILNIIRKYTMESGVRNLEREIATVIRKIARKAVSGGYSEKSEEAFKVTVTSKSLKKHLGNPRFEDDIVYKKNRKGLVYGLAWTEMGGKILPIEASLLKGTGKLILTGSLGDVMKESAQIALSFIREHFREFNLESDFHEEIDIHIHVPQGAIPKDGPSAGITMTTAMISALTEKIVRPQTAMTGEITLTGRILPIGGVKEKVLAAYRNKMTAVILPEENRKDTEELPSEVLREIDFFYADSIQNAMKILFEDNSDKD
ncbi:MAG: endopeptidase La [Spirochaetes bacterium]|nr:MAG: endopeptidase La [Spirochaetota bacterium]